MIKTNVSQLVLTIAFLLSPLLLGQNESTPSSKTHNCPTEENNPNYSKVQLIQKYSLYKTNYDTEQYQEAYPYVQFLINNAPGFRESIFINGEKILKQLIQNTTGEQKDQHVNELLITYDKRAECWGKESFLAGKKGLAIARYYPDKITESYELLKTAIKGDQ